MYKFSFCHYINLIVFKSSDRLTNDFSTKNDLEKELDLYFSIFVSAAAAMLLMQAQQIDISKLNYLTGHP